MCGIKTHEAEFMGLYSILMVTSHKKQLLHYTDNKGIASHFRCMESVRSLQVHPERIVKTDSPVLKIKVVALCERFIESGGRWRICHHKRNMPEIKRVHNTVRSRRR